MKKYLYAGALNLAYFIEQLVNKFLGIHFSIINLDNMVKIIEYIKELPVFFIIVLQCLFFIIILATFIVILVKVFIKLFSNNKLRLAIIECKETIQT